MPVLAQKLRDRIDGHLISVDDEKTSHERVSAILMPRSQRREERVGSMPMKRKERRPTQGLHGCCNNSQTDPTAPKPSEELKACDLTRWNEAPSFATPPEVHAPQRS
jgi:hypothetical protein